MKSGIDADILRRVVGNDPEFLREVLEDFVCHAQSEITAIRAAFVSQDAEQMKIPTHRFKGSASLMGARQVVEVCTRLEAAAGANDWPMIQSLISGRADAAARKSEWRELRREEPVASD